MPKPKAVSYLAVRAGSAPLQSRYEEGEPIDRRGMVQLTMSLDYLKGQPIGIAHLTFERALALQADLAKAILQAQARGAQRLAEKEVPL